MSEINKKSFLDQEGLELYDKLIKTYIDSKTTAADGTTVAELAEKVGNAAVEGKEATGLYADIAANKAAIDVLNGDKTVEGSVAQQVNEAVNGLVAGAPAALDTLKEIADWVSTDTTGAATLVSRVSTLEDKVGNAAVEEVKDDDGNITTPASEATGLFADVANNASNIAENTAAIENLQNVTTDLKAYVDAQDQSYYDSINSLSEGSIKAMFLDPVSVAEGETVQEAIDNLEEGQKLVLEDDNAEDLNIPADAVIDADGHTLSGNITAAEGATVLNAVFTGTVTVQ